MENTDRPDQGSALVRIGRWVGRAATVAVAIGVGLAAWAFWIEPSRFTLRLERVEVPGWPPACDGLRFAVLADLHVGSPYFGVRKYERVVEAVNLLRADAVLLAGDYVIQNVIGGRFVDPGEIASVLGGLESRQGTFGVLGNHDWWHDGPAVRRALESSGIVMLEDESTQITAGDCRFYLAGIGDFWEGEHDIDAALGEVPSEATVIALTHNPDLFPEVPPRVALTIAGHTHGGQVNLPIVGRPIVPSQYGERYAQGLVVESDRRLFVTSGLGTSLLPVRFRVPPEIIVLQLRSTKAAAPVVESREERQAHGADR